MASIRMHPLERGPDMNIPVPPRWLVMLVAFFVGVGFMRWLGW